MTEQPMEMPGKDPNPTPSPRVVAASKTEEALLDMEQRLRSMADYLAECRAVVDDLFPEEEEKRKPISPPSTAMWRG